MTMAGAVLIVVSADHLLLVQTPGIHREIHSNTQRNPAGTEHAIGNYMDADEP